jgi:hypothetical protein
MQCRMLPEQAPQQRRTAARHPEQDDGPVAGWR